MSIRNSILAVAAAAFWVPALALAQSNAYVLLSESTSGSITPLNPESGSLGASCFVPAGGALIVVAPGSKQIWEVIGIDSGPASIAVLDPKSCATLANIPLGVYVESLTFDPAGHYAYVSAIGYLIKIDVASRTVAGKVAQPSSDYAIPGQVAFSSDGKQLFLSYGPGVVAVVDPVSLKTVSSIPLPFNLNSIFVSGSTLLVTGGAQLLYLDTATLQQTNSATVPQYSHVFGVSGDGSKIYLYSYNLPSANTMAVLDFSSGQTLVSQTFPPALVNVMLSPDGRQIVVAYSPVVLVDAGTLATTKTLVPMGSIAGAAYLDSKTVALLNGAGIAGGAMAVIDQSTAQITATFPIALDTPLAESALADPKLGAIWVGGYEAAALSAVSAASNRVVQSLLVYGFSPAARVGDQIFGTDNSAASYYNLKTGATGFLPHILNLGPNYFEQDSLGAASPDGKFYWVPFVVSFGGGGEAQIPSSGFGIYNTTSDSVEARLSPPGYFAGPFVFRPDNTTAYIATANAIAVYDSQTLQGTQTFNYTTTFSALAISPDGSTLYATDGTAIYVLNSTTGAQEQLFLLPSPPPYYPGVMALSPDGTTLFLTNSSANVVYLIDTTSGQIRQVPVGSFPSSIAVLPN